MTITAYVLAYLALGWLVSLVCHLLLDEADVWEGSGFIVALAWPLALFVVCFVVLFLGFLESPAAIARHIKKKTNASKKSKKTD